jgi:hypothetical protein
MAVFSYSAKYPNLSYRERMELIARDALGWFHILQNKPERIKLTLI